MKSIIVATDFSAAAENAMIYGARLAKNIEASLCLLHTYEMPVGMMGMADMADMGALMVSSEEIKKNSDEGLQKAKELVQKSVQGITIETEARLGELADELNIACREREAFAIIIGIKNYSGIEKFLFGNAAMSIIRHCKYPLISVPSEAHGESPGNVVLATDLTNLDKMPVTEIVGIIQTLKAKLHIVHIAEREEESIIEKEYLLNVLNEINPAFHTITDEDVLHGLQTYVQQNNVDLLLTLPHKHNLYERVFFKLHTEGLINKMPIPVMSVQ